MMKSLETMRIGVIGGGISGLSVGLALLRSGHDVTIFEQARRLDEVGAGLSISPNAALGLDYLDMLDFMDRHANKPLTQYTHHGLTNESLLALDRRGVRRQYGASYYQLHRADFHHELFRRIDDINPQCIELGSAVADVTQDDQGVTITLADKRTHHFDCLIGADGVKSVVRDRIFGKSEAEFTGHVAYRALIPAESLPDFFSQAASHVWIGKGRNCVTYPVKGDKLVNFVALALSDEWAEEGWQIRAERSELKDLFKEFHELPRIVIDQIPLDGVYKWGLFARETLDCLYNERVVLVGDAAHPMLPYFGQGASSSIEDAVVLARCIDAGGGHQKAFSRYDAARLERVTTLQRESNLGGERLHKLDPYDLRDKPLRNEDALGIFDYNPARIVI